MKRRAWLLWILLAVSLTSFASFADDKGAKDKAPAVSLQDAYKREFAFLQSEKASLQKRLEQQRAESQRKVAAAEGELAAVQGQVLATSVEADRLAGLLDNASTRADAASEGKDVIDTLLGQASATLEKGNIKLPEGEGEEARIIQLKTAFEKSIELLAKYASIRSAPGSFFAADGRQVEGTLLTIGNVATYGVSDSAAGALAPAGQDRLKVWPEQPSDTYARALAQGQHPGNIGIFIYESLDKGIDAKVKQSTYEHVDSGGLIAWVIVVLGLVGLLLIVARAIILGLSGSGIDALLKRVSPVVSRGDIASALKICKTSRGSAARVLGVAVENLSAPRERLEDAVSEATLHEHTKLDRFGALIIVIAGVAPLLGLLGTVTGMISTFDVITEFGTGDPKMLSGGISEALITTELGLVVAIPALLAGNILSGWASGIKDALDKAVLRVANVGTGVEVEDAPQGDDSTKELAPAAS